MVNPTPTQEEREIIIRDKAAREGLSIPDDVVSYIAAHRTSDQSLKSALINLSAYAYRKQTPITLQMAELVLEGVRTGVNVKHAAELTREIPAIAESDEITFAVDKSEATAKALSNYGLPSFLSGPASPISEALSDESAIALDEVPEYTHFNDAVADEPMPEESSHRESTPSEPEYIDPLRDEAVYREPEYVEPEYVVPELDEPPLNVPVFAEPEYSESVLSEPTYNVPVYNEPVLEIEPDTAAAPTLFDDIAEEPSAAQVFFAPMKTTQKRSLVERAGIALMRAGLDKVIASGDIVAVKVHVGEAGNTGFVSPLYAREVVRLIKELGGKPFLTDANTLYSGQRKNAVDHMTCAVHNGFSFATIEAPFIVADGLLGNDWIDVEVGGLHCETVRMGSAAVEADAMVVISHVKGHGVAGFGGAVKNVGMGLGSRSAKQRMHSDVLPEVDAKNCTRCKRCVEKCPVEAITIDVLSRAARIDQNVCYGCGECVAQCNYDAIAISWQTDPDNIQEKMVEHAAGITKGKQGKMIYLSFLTDITPECDCWSFSDAAIVPDIGLLASRDMIAIDQAAYDMVVEAVGNRNSDAAGMGAGSDKFTEISGTDGTHVMAYGEEFGLGTRQYAITEIG